jgi:hypothetical protein
MLKAETLKPEGSRQGGDYGTTSEAKQKAESRKLKWDRNYRHAKDAES